MGAKFKIARLFVTQTRLVSRMMSKSRLLKAIYVILRIIWTPLKFQTTFISSTKFCSPLCNCCGRFGVSQHKQGYRRGVGKHQKPTIQAAQWPEQSTAHTTLRHWSGNDSAESDHLELELLHIFQQEDCGKAQFEVEKPTLSKVQVTNQNSGSLIVVCLNIQTWREAVQGFI